MLVGYGSPAPAFQPVAVDSISIATSRSDISLQLIDLPASIARVPHSFRTLDLQSSLRSLRSTPGLLYSLVLCFISFGFNITL